MTRIKPSNRVAVVGAGMVGSTIAYSLLCQEIAEEILLIDINKPLLDAQVRDLQDAGNFTRRDVEVKPAEYSELQDGDIVVVTAGAAQKPGQTRTDLLEINVKITKSILDEIQKTGKTVYVMMVSNPVDVLTYIATKQLSLPKGYVFGSGTNLDTSRLKNAIKDKRATNSSELHTYIWGEHGDSSFPVLSNAKVAGEDLNKYLRVESFDNNQISEDVRQGAYKIIEGKGSTYFGIGSSVADICKCIIGDERRIIAVCSLLEGEYSQSEVVFSVPSIISAGGVEVIDGIELNENERELLEKSSDVIRNNIKLAKDIEEKLEN